MPIALSTCQARIVQQAVGGTEIPSPEVGGGGRGVGADAPAATFGAHLRAVRICFSAAAEKQYSYPAQPSVNGVCKGESSVPLCPVLVSFAGAKETPRRRAVQTKSHKRLCTAVRREQATPNTNPPPKKKSPFRSLSEYLPYASFFTAFSRANSITETV